MALFLTHNCHLCKWVGLKTAFEIKVHIVRENKFSYYVQWHTDTTTHTHTHTHTDIIQGPAEIPHDLATQL